MGAVQINWSHEPTEDILEQACLAPVLAGAVLTVFRYNVKFLRCSIAVFFKNT